METPLINGPRYTDPETERQRHGGLDAEDAKAIAERGFSGYVEDLEAKKKEELRAKILQSMGLTEDMLDKMPASQRAEIEKLIAQEIQARMQGGSILNDSDKSPVSAQNLAAAAPSGMKPTGGLILDPTLFTGQNLPGREEDEKG
ncbi:hypothetical protein [Magnetospira sp. QH-2]|uniref:hypothetical protein n=1 Tax=Magnetospira sp. (strain QH-2) TaxID=1288970 RepID=UPI0003E810DB|nr:hypothetical protein [Magnetospira sp. QH-2]CCQ73269.1 Protein of unknown function [Magnetospira sp. QH-2]